MPAAKAQQDFLTRDDALRWVRKLMPLRHLSEQEFEIITTDTSVEFCAAGGTLFRSGQDDHFIFYLLSGKIAIRDREGNAFSIVGGSIEARHSLTPHAKARVCATAKTAVQFVRLPANLINLQHQDSEGITVDTIDEHEAAFDKRILFDVYHWLMSGDLVLPSLPDIALRIRQAAANENVAVEDIARIVQSDASTSAYCISVANSAALVASGQCTRRRREDRHERDSGSGRCLYDSELVHRQGCRIEEFDA